MVGNIVDVGWATIKSGCLPITARYPIPVLQFLGLCLKIKTKMTKTETRMHAAHFWHILMTTQCCQLPFVTKWSLWQDILVNYKKHESQRV